MNTGPGTMTAALPAVSDVPLVQAKSSALHRIDRLILGYRGAKALLTAVTLDLFTVISRGRQTAESLSKTLKTNPRSTAILLDALVALEFLYKDNSHYRNTPLATEYLVRGSRNYLGNNLHYQEMAWQCWSGLTQMTRTGRSEVLVRDLLSRSPQFAKAYILGMDNIASVPARAIANRLPLKNARRILDVGAGPGAYTRAFLEKYPRLTAVLFDLPSALAVTKAVFRNSPLKRRVIFKAGDYHNTPFEKKAFDAVLLSHVTHNEDDSANAALARKSYAALRPGGLLAIHDFTVKEDGTGPLFASLLSLHMMVTTGRGRIYSRPEYERWMRSAGFSRTEAWEVPSDLENQTWVITGFKGLCHKP